MIRHALLALVAICGAAPALAGFPPTFDWKRLGREDGLPVLKTLSVEILDGTIYAGTGKGLYMKTGNEPFRRVDLGDIKETSVLIIRADRTRKDVWVGTMHGLVHLTQGRVDVFTQLNSGLANNVIYSLDPGDRHLWVATAAGASRLDLRTGRWEIYNEKSSPMKEIWCYGVSGTGNLVYLGVWGGGVMEYNYTTGVWKNYFDPDGEFELDLFRNDGVPSNIVSNVDYDGKTVWASTYFGVGSYDGRHWREWFEDTGEGLPSNFVHLTRSDLLCPGRTRPERVWTCTDRGVGCFDGKIWSHEIADVQAHSVSFEKDTVVVGTDNGVFVGTPRTRPAGPGPRGDGNRGGR
ncbi:MAG: hypothetical protein HY815_27155 [Candidatus Riflebacteria bacterium]|nr:hypothetical protein [Candidatus Riflebacteria bacterium]